MRDLVKRGKAMPAPEQDRPGRFQIRNRADLQNAIRAVGRVRPNTEEARAKVRRFILKRARELNLASLIPPNWAADGSLKP
ncbi:MULTISPECIES: hypothetical protein [Streptomyces]|uniref:hypothetical protein n=1 Tax=Streptomyces TaxID=1883 RepID=UPI000F768A1A|nr:hypothetical protein [Streptomyces sp. WAC05858]RSS45452.1 hypothetical protein EF902_14165 [Streptomyces sp. WAC05858]